MYLSLDDAHDTVEGVAEGTTQLMSQLVSHLTLLAYRYKEASTLKHPSRACQTGESQRKRHSMSHLC